MRRVIAVIAFVVLTMPAMLLAYVSPGSPKGSVNDFANILPVDIKAQFEQSILALRNQTGDQIAVVTIASLGDETIESYATKLFEEWGIGEKGKDNGLLILVAPDERKVRIEVGYGLEPLITDALSSRIIRDQMIPLFKTGDYSGAIYSALGSIISTLSGNTAPVDGGNANQVPGLGDTDANVQILVPVSLFLAFVIGITKWWPIGGVWGAFVGMFLFNSFPIALVFALFGMGIGFALSTGKSTGSSIGGFRGGGGSGGFGGGRSGGGGASGSW